MRTGSNRFSFSRVEPELDVDELPGGLLQLLQQDGLPLLHQPDLPIEFLLLTLDLKKLSAEVEQKALAAKGRRFEATHGIKSTERPSWALFVRCRRFEATH